MLNKGAGKELALYFTIVVEVVTPVIGGFIVGNYIDKYFDTRPFLALTLSALGIGVGFVNLFRILRLINGHNREDRRH